MAKKIIERTVQSGIKAVVAGAKRAASQAKVAAAPLKQAVVDSVAPQATRRGAAAGIKQHTLPQLTPAQVEAGRAAVHGAKGAKSVAEQLHLTATELAARVKQAIAAAEPQLKELANALKSKAAGGMSLGTASIMLHVDGVDRNNDSHVATMQSALARLSLRFPRAGFVLQLGQQFFKMEEGALVEVPWTTPTPPPVVTRMSAINLPRHGRCVYVEGNHLKIERTPAAAAPEAAAALEAAAENNEEAATHQAAQQLMNMSANAGVAEVTVETGENPPLILYCIQAGVVQAEKLRPMFSTPDGKKALFAAPRVPLPAAGTVILRLRRGHAFAPDVTMTNWWLQEPRT